MFGRKSYAGTDVDQLRRALKEFGFQMGPLTALGQKKLRALTSDALLAGWSDDDPHWAVWDHRRRRVLDPYPFTKRLRCTKYALVRPLAAAKRKK